MLRITKSELDHRVMILNNRVAGRVDVDPSRTFSIDHAYGAYRLMRRERDGYNFVSPRLSARELATFIDGMFAALDINL